MNNLWLTVKRRIVSCQVTYMITSDICYCRRDLYKCLKGSTLKREPKGRSVHQPKGYSTAVDRSPASTSFAFLTMRLPMRCYRLSPCCGLELSRWQGGGETDVRTKFCQNIQLQSQNPQAALYSLRYFLSLHVVLSTPHSTAFAP